MKTLKQHIMLENDIADPTDIDSLWECFTWRSNEGYGGCVWEGDYDEHRWYISYTKVIQYTIDGVDRFFEYTECNPKGECSSREDCGWEKPDLDDLVEVFPKEVKTIVYVSEDKL